MDRRQHSLTLMLFAYLAAIAAGVNFYSTVDDTPLATAMRDHAALSASWNLILAGSVLALAAVAMVGIPMLLTMKRRDVVYRLAVPPFAALVTLAWMVAVARLSGGHWVPTPWDITGDWTAPHDWPPLATRWALGSVTFVLMMAGLLVSSISVRQAIRRSDWSKHGRLWFAAPSTLLAGSIAIMTLGLLGWGSFVERYAASDFHLRNGGLFSSTNFGSWIASCVVFLAATVMAVKGARSALVLKTE